MSERVFGGRFELRERAGVGGAAHVFRAFDRETEGEVALKELYLPNADAELRFARECALLAAVEEPGIVRYVAHGKSDEGQCWLAMQWIEGPTLSRILKKDALRRSDALVLLRHVSLAVAALHRRGIVHRDIKPGNIILEHGSLSQPKLIDLGIARGNSDEELTATGVIVGTMGFMAPEQAAGRRDVDARADVFALGCLLFKCITGRVPFLADEPLATLLRVALEHAPRLSSVDPTVSPALDAAVARLLARDRANRPRDAGEVAALLAGLEGEEEPSAPSPVSVRDPSPVTTTESRLAFLVLGRTAGLEAGRASPLFALVSRSLASVGVRPELLVDGTLVVVVSGTHAAPGDLAHRAARAALAVRSVFPMAVVVVTTGRSSFGAPHLMGEAIERGSSLLGRAMSSGQPGDVVLDDSMSRLLGERFEIDASEGRFLLVAERGAPELTAPALATRFIGRERELSFLASLTEEVARERRARVALVVAPAGSGKSRLAGELARRLEGGGFELWIAQGDPLAKESALGMLTPLLARLAGLVRGEPGERSFAKIEALVGRTARPEQAAEISEFVGELLGAKSPYAPSAGLSAARRDATLMGDRLRRAVASFIRSVADARPVALVLDDLQWADHATITFVEAAARALDAAPFFVLCLARPEIRSAHPRLLAGRGAHEVQLDGLSDAAATTLAVELFGQGHQLADQELLRRIVERAAGNPFFLEELVRAARAGDVSELPDSVLAVLEARLDALPTEARRVLRAASVFGRSFATGGVAALLPKVPVEDHLAFLEQEDVIAESPTSRFRDETEWTFRNALLVDAAYARLPTEDRARAHLSAARWLENAGESDPALLAMHFERGGDQKSARSLLLAAAQLALEATDLAQAVALAERAVRCGAEGVELGASSAVIAEASLWLGKNEDALAAARCATANLPAGQPTWCHALAAGSAAAQRVDDLAELDRYVAELGALDLGAEPSPEMIVAISQTAIQLAFRGRVEAAGVLLDRIPTGHAQKEPGSAAWVFRARAWRALASGDPGAYGMLMRRSAASFEQIGDLRNACVQRVNVAYASMNTGYLEDAEKGFVDVLETAAQMGLGMVEPVARHNLGLVHAWLGDPARGEKEERLAIAAFEGQGDARMLAASFGYLARILSERGAHEKAIEAAERAVATAPHRSPVQVVALASLALVLLRAPGERGPRALDTAARARRLLDELGGIDEGEALCRLAHVSALAAVASPEEARAAALEAGQWLDDRRDRVTPAAARACFMTRVPENAALDALRRRFDV